MRSLRSSRLVLSATSALGLAGTRRRGGAGGIGAWVSPGPWRMKPPGPTERYWIVGFGRCGRCVGRRRRALALGAAAAGARRRGLGRGLFGRRARGRGGRGGAVFSFSSPGLTGDGRASRPRRCALPITALRLTPPSSSAIWLAVAPSATSSSGARSARRSRTFDQQTPMSWLRGAGAQPIGDCRSERPALQLAAECLGSHPARRSQR